MDQLNGGCGAPPAFPSAHLRPPEMLNLLSQSWFCVYTPTWEKCILSFGGDYIPFEILRGVNGHVAPPSAISFLSLTPPLHIRSENMLFWRIPYTGT